MKKIIALSSIAFLATTAFASADADRIADLEKKLDKLSKKVSKVNALAAKDNIKWDVDFRTAVDKLTYTDVNGNDYKNDALMTNRLWLGMGYAPTENILFRGQLAVNKAFGASYNQRATGMGFDTFDWVINENLTDETVRLREAYWLWTDSFGGIGFTASVGRRPATNGFLANLREDDKAKSPMGHVINMEFDGGSASVKLDKYVPGMMFKLCLGRGLTNATGWSSTATSYSQLNNATFTGLGNPGASTLPNYTVDPNGLETVDMAGFIFKPYDDGQYSIVSTWYRGLNVPGMVATSMNAYYAGSTGASMGMEPTAMQMASTGNMDGMALSVKVDGIGDGISDFLDETTVFASYAMTKSDPDTDITRSVTQIDVEGVNPTATGPMTGTSMMGSADSETGTSIWAGIVIPNMTGGKFGLEYNQGSEYWRPFTYGEDTMIGSKLATRGTAIEAYWTQPLIEDAFSMQIRYTKIDYDYTGSDGFFGDGSTPYEIDSATAAAMGAIESAEDIRLYFRYRY